MEKRDHLVQRLTPDKGQCVTAAVMSAVNTYGPDLQISLFRGFSATHSRRDAAGRLRWGSRCAELRRLETHGRLRSS